MSDAKVWGLIGLASRAGQVASGESACEIALRRGEAALVLLDEGASAGTRKALSDACAYRGVPLFAVEAGRIAASTGKPGRMAAAVKPGSLAQQLHRLLQPDSNI